MVSPARPPRSTGPSGGLLHTVSPAPPLHCGLVHMVVLARPPARTRPPPSTVVWCTWSCSHGTARRGRCFAFLAQALQVVTWRWCVLHAAALRRSIERHAPAPAWSCRGARAAGVLFRARARARAVWQAAHTWCRLASRVHRRDMMKVHRTLRNDLQALQAVSSNLAPLVQCRSSARLEAHRTLRDDLQASYPKIQTEAGQASNCRRRCA